MTDTRELLSYLNDMQFNLRRIKAIEDSIKSMTDISAVNYESTGGGGTPELCRVERYVDKMLELKQELEQCKQRLKLTESIMKADILTDDEYELIEWLQLGGKLSVFARRKGLYKSRVYKIRDRALQKIKKYTDNMKWGVQ
jgi:hypothetical protein